jgi:hypothetical protein
MKKENEKINQEMNTKLCVIITKIIIEHFKNNDILTKKDLDIKLMMELIK